MGSSCLRSRSWGLVSWNIVQNIYWTLYIWSSNFYVCYFGGKRDDYRFCIHAWLWMNEWTNTWMNEHEYKWMNEYKGMNISKNMNAKIWMNMNGYE